MTSSKVYLLLSHVADGHNIPRDVIAYMITYFYEPFEQAKRESKRINELHLLFLGEPVEEEDMCMPPLLGIDNEALVHLPLLGDLLHDTSLILDIRIDDGRILKYVEIFREPWIFEAFDSHLITPILQKGIILGSVSAFQILNDNGLFVKSVENLAFLQYIINQLILLPNYRINPLALHDMISYCLYSGLADLFFRFYGISKRKVKELPNYFIPYKMTMTRKMARQALLQK